jgi:YbbR domain-containing protein
MNRGPVRWLVRNFRTLLLAFGLALLVWVSSVVAADPNESRTFPSVPLETIGKAPNMLVTSEIPQTVSVTLYAPRSWLDRYDSEQGLLRAVLDMSGKEQGTHQLEVQIYPALEPTRVEQVLPDTLEVTLDRLVNNEKPIRLEVTGRPASGYQAGEPVLEASTSTVTGAESKVSQVATLLAALDITNADETIEIQLTLRPVNVKW